MSTPIHVVGLGPAGLGFAVVADRLRVFDDLVRRGLRFYDRKPDVHALTESYFPWNIRSNSVGKQFLENIRPDGLFRPAFESVVAREIRAKGDAAVPLRLVGQLMSDLLHCLLRTESSGAGPRIHLGYAVCAFEQAGEHGWRPRLAEGEGALDPGTAVVAIGSEERLVEEHSGAPIMASGSLLRNAICVEGIVKSGKLIQIIGSSHSAFSAAELLLRTYGNRLRAAQIVIRAERVRVYYASEREAREAGYTVRAGDCDPETGEVHRFNGLRSDAGRLYRRIVTGEERRVAIRFRDDDEDIDPLEIGLTVSAVGCKPRSFELIDERGRAIEPLVDEGYVRVDDSGRIYCTRGHFLPALYGIGIGFPHRTPVGIARVGINIFHGSDGEAVVSDILDQVGRRTHARDGLEQGVSQ